MEPIYRPPPLMSKVTGQPPSRTTPLGHMSCSFLILRGEVAEFSKASEVTLCSRHHKVPRIAEHELGQKPMHRTPRYPASDKVTPALCIFCTIRVTSSGVELLQQNAVQNGCESGSESAGSAGATQGDA